MVQRLCSLLLLSSLFIAFLPGVAIAAPTDCAFLDVDDDGVKGPGDIPVTDDQWLGGQPFVAPHPFVVPVGCNHKLTTLSAPLAGVEVTATKITFLGALEYLPPGGKGVFFIADPKKVPQPPGKGDGSITVGDGVTPHVKIEGGGYNTLSSSSVPAVPRKSVALWASGPCSVNNAEISGNRPIQDTMVAVLCDGDVVLRAATITGSGVNIQSLHGKIDAQSFSALGSKLANACDSPTLNVLGNGDGNGKVEPGDFPCEINLAAVGLPPGFSPEFQNLAELKAWCEPVVGSGSNDIEALNDPLIMIAKQALDLHGVAGPSGKTVLVGKTRVVLASESGNIDTSHTSISHSDPPPGGAFMYLFASPDTIVRTPTEREDFTGPSGKAGATANITGACYEGDHAKNPVQVGKRADGTMPLVGVPDPPSCKQLPPDFVPILGKSF